MNALWVSVLFDFGEGGVAVLAAMMIAAAWRMRHSPPMTAVLLPFFVASLVNSSIPDWSFVALGIMLFGLGWAPKSMASMADGRENARLFRSTPWPGR